MSEDQLWLVTVALPDRYFTVRLAIDAPTEQAARGFAAAQLATLREYVPKAALVITDVEAAS